MAVVVVDAVPSILRPILGHDARVPDLVARPVHLDPLIHQGLGVARVGLDVLQFHDVVVAGLLPDLLVRRGERRPGLRLPADVRLQNLAPLVLEGRPEDLRHPIDDHVVRVRRRLAVQRRVRVHPPHVRREARRARLPVPVSLQPPLDQPQVDGVAHELRVPRDALDGPREGLGHVQLAQPAQHLQTRAARHARRGLDARPVLAEVALGGVRVEPP